MQFLQKRPSYSVLAIVMLLLASACGDSGDDTTTTALELIAPTTAASATTLVSGPGGEYGCRDLGPREHDQPASLVSDSLSVEDAQTAPELHPGRMAYIIDLIASGEDTSAFNPTAAELAAADDYIVMDDAREALLEAVNSAAGNDFAASWVTDISILNFATTGDPAVVETALAGTNVDFQVVEVDFRARQLSRWQAMVNDQAVATNLVTASIDEVRNVVTVRVGPEAPLDLSEIPCTAVEIELIDDVNTAPAHTPDAAPPPNQEWLLESRPAVVVAGDDLDYGEPSAPCAQVGVWSDGAWVHTGLAEKSIAWHSEATDLEGCDGSLNPGYSTLVVPAATLPGWYRICIEAPDECALLEVVGSS